MCVLVLAVGACSLLGAEQCLHEAVVTVAPGSGHCHPTLSLLLGLWALPISSLAPAPSSLQVLSGVFRGASPQVLQGAQEMCARNVVGFMFPILPILF